MKSQTFASADVIHCGESEQNYISTSIHRLPPRKVIQNRLQFSYLVLRTGKTTTQKRTNNGFHNTKIILVSGLYRVDSGFWIPCKWNLDPRLQTLAEFRILQDESRIPKPRISNSGGKNFAVFFNPDCPTWGQLMTAQAFVLKEGNTMKYTG